MGMSQTDKYYEIMGRLAGMKIPPHIWNFIVMLPKASVVSYFEDCLETSEVLDRYEDLEEI